MATSPGRCECVASTHAANGVKLRGIPTLACGAEVEGKNVICRPCAVGNHEREVCPEYVPAPVAPHLDRRCRRCGFDSAKHPIPKGGLSSKPGPVRAYGRVPETTTGPGHVTELDASRLRRWLGRMIPTGRVARLARPYDPFPAFGEFDDVLEIESASGRQVTAPADGPDAVVGVVAIVKRRPCQRCRRPTDDLPTFPSRSADWEFTRCPRCHRSTLHPIEAAAVA